MDPAPTVPLNNAEAVLAAQEREEVAQILAHLSAAVADNAARIWQVRKGMQHAGRCTHKTPDGVCCFAHRPLLEKEIR